MDSAYKQVIKSFTEGWSVAHRYLNAKSIDIGGRFFVELELKRKGGLASIPIAITNSRYDLPAGAQSQVALYFATGRSQSASKYSRALLNYIRDLPSWNGFPLPSAKGTAEVGFFKPRVDSADRVVGVRKQWYADVHAALATDPNLLIETEAVSGANAPTGNEETSIDAGVPAPPAWSVPALDQNQLAAARQHSQYKIALTDYGTKIFNLCVALDGSPIYMEGEAGAGKTFMGHMLGEHTGKAEINSITFTSRIDQELLVGTPRPTNVWMQTDGTVVNKSGIGEDMSAYKYLGIGLEWQDGSVTKMVRPTGKGGMLILDELPKAPPEFNNRLHSLMEDGYRHFTVYENSESQTEVHPDLWIYATGNPTGGGYFNNPLDKALLDRMRVIQIRGELADEAVILEGLLPEFAFDKTATKLRRMAVSMREEKTTSISTRALIMTAKTMLRGIDVTTAIVLCHVNTLKEKEQRERAMSVFATHFEKDYEKAGGLTGVNL